MKKFPFLFIVLGCLQFLSCRSQVKPVPQQRAGNDTTYTYLKASRDGTGKFYQGREIAQVMSAAGNDWLERNERDEEENTSAAIAYMKLQPNSVVADIGAGTGYYSFRLAPKVPQGKIYAVEIQEESIAFLREKKTLLRDSVIEVITGSEQSVNLPASSTDLALMVDVYHELSYPHEVLQSLYTALKPGGKLLLIEYRGEDPAVQIKPLHKTTIAQINKEMAANGFILKEAPAFLPIQHYLLYEKTVRQ